MNLVVRRKTIDYRAASLNWRYCGHDYLKGRHTVQEGGQINVIIKRSRIFLVSQQPELEPCLAISLEIATQSGLDLILKNHRFKMTALYSDK